MYIKYSSMALNVRGRLILFRSIDHKSKTPAIAISWHSLFGEPFVHFYYSPETPNNPVIPLLGKYLIEMCNKRCGQEC